MTEKKASTYEEILRHLLNGAEVKRTRSNRRYFLRNGRLMASDPWIPGNVPWYQSQSFEIPADWELVPKVVSRWQNVYRSATDDHTLRMGDLCMSRGEADRSVFGERYGLWRTDIADDKVIARVLEPVNVQVGSQQKEVGQ